MRVCLIAPFLHSPGGQAVQAMEIGERLKEEGIEVGYIPINPRFEGLLGFLQRYKYVRTLITSLAYIKNLIKKIPQYDVLHVFSASYFSFLIAPTPAVLIGRYFRKRIILNYHSGEAEDHLSHSQGFIKRILRFVDIIVVPSFYLQQVFSKFGIDCEVVHNVVNEEVFKFRKREKYHPKYIVTRNLEPIYNIECILRAFRFIQIEFPDAMLTVIGCGSQEQHLKSLVGPLKLENVTFMGAVGRNSIPDYYDQSDFMLNASNIDNMPMSILEAFSSGIPVISTEAGGIPDIIRDGENGMLVPLNDDKAMAEKAIYLLENQEVARRIAEQARQDCVIKYSWDIIRKKWLELYAMR
jgi:glycosyltransferase involved in cell wall biosynthesis